MRTERDIWRYRSGLEVSSDLTGYSIEALDGSIGKVDECTAETTGNYLVVDTGPWIFGKKVMLPGGVIDTVDDDTETVYVNRTKDEIKNAPEFDPDTYRSESYRTELGGYYGEGGRGYREERSHRSEVL
jgi:hypothetical protein